MAAPSPFLRRWYQSLMLRFAILGLVLWLLFTTISALLQDQIGTDTAGQDQETIRRMGLEYDLISQRAQTLAGSIAQTAVISKEGLSGLRVHVPALIERHADAGLLAAVGLWPLPNTLDPARERASLVWLRNSGGTFQIREDYNDLRTVPYTREKWFTPARYSPHDRCYWTPAYQEPLTRRAVSTCAYPIHTAQGFVGVVTVSLDLDAVAQNLETMAGMKQGYSLLTTLAGDVVLTTGMPSDRPTRIANLAELSRENPGLNGLALQIHQDYKSIISAATPNATQIAALKNDSRDMSHEEAESALVSLALAASANELQLLFRQIPISEETTLGSATATLFSLPGQWWIFIAITPAKAIFAGPAWLSRDLVIVSSAMLSFALLMLWGLRRWLLLPLREMTIRLAANVGARDAYRPLRNISRDELGALAYWHNESLRLLQDQILKMRDAQSQVTTEHGERRNTQESLLKARTRSAIALQAITDGVIIFTEQGHVESMNLAAEKLTGLSLHAALGKPFGEVFKVRQPAEAKQVTTNLTEIALRLKTPMEYPQTLQLLSANGAAQDIHLIFHPVLSPQGENSGGIAVFRRLDGKAQTQPQPAERHMLDGMTGLPMRGTCENDLRVLINKAKLTPQTHGLLFIDVDDLKLINDTKGQRAGDEVIAQIAGILIGIVGKYGHEAYRLYGDQFAILLKATRAPNASAFAEQLCARFSGSALRGNFRITISIGICMLDGTSPSPSELIRRSELACTVAKRAGRNRVQEWMPALEESKRQADDALWLNRIRAGLEQDMFHLTTQYLAPTAANKKGELAFQILLALEDEEGFWSAPNTFMPTAQRHNLTGEMDRWIIDHSISQLQQQPEILGKIGFICIHLSEYAISDNGLLEHLLKLFSNNSTLPAGKFCFEFSEYSLQKYPHQTQVFCDVMRNLGCHLCINEFAGRHTSDVAQFKKLAVDFIRMDAAQYPNMDTDSAEWVLTEYLVRLARSLSKNIIVSNIETPGQLQAWQKLGADYLQGSAIAKPTPVIFSAPA